MTTVAPGGAPGTGTESAIGMGVDQLDTPAVVVDLDRLEANLSRMAECASRAGVRLRPHAKTHKSAWIASEQLRHGAGGLTVAKLGEAEAFIDAGATDILIAYPIVGEQKLARLHELALRARVIANLDDVAVAEGLSRMARSLPKPLEVMVEVDSGLHRVGKPPGAPSAAIAREVARLPGLTLLGLLTHAGHSYLAKSAEERESIALDEARALVDTAEVLEADGLHVREMSVGSTPTSASLERVKAAYPAITEIRPGTYVFNDVNQLSLGVATEEDCALRIVVTVISRPAADRMVVDAGSKTFAADAGLTGGFGRVVGHPEFVVERLSEEHAVVVIPPSATCRIGDRLEIIPNHACPVPNLADSIVGVRAGRVEWLIRIDARGRNR
jgi:D-serine deaminase-like pyridoxal phosphate-dependent protein